MLKLKQTDFLDYSFFRLPEKIGGNLPGVHYIRDVADADALVSSLVSLTVFTFSHTYFNWCFLCCNLQVITELPI